jgi:beta-phosphoglucomutase-like phosphatase (HAD superfamily)
MVREFGFVPERRVLDAAGYKELYNEALMQIVSERIERVRRSELDTGDWTVKGAVPFLRELHRRGIRLYLASGTDEHDVRNEAEVLGYAELFEGRIFGAVGDVARYSKKMVIDRIVREHDLSGPELVTFGDGPVELRETVKRDGIAVGVASDEIRRFGPDITKRSRLIRAGADLVVPDFSQGQKLLEHLLSGGLPEE